MSQATTADEAHQNHATCTGIDNKKLMMWLFLASDCMFFGTLISTHLIYRKLHPAGATSEGTVNITGMFDIELTSFSTFILLMSSFLMALAVSAMHKGQIRSFRNNCLGVIFFGLIFLGCQVYEFHHFLAGKAAYTYAGVDADGEAVNGKYVSVEDSAHAKEIFESKHSGWQLAEFKRTEVIAPSMSLQNSIFGSTFYLMTGTHGVHVAIGVLWLLSMYIYSFTGKLKAKDAMDVEIAGLYWHFVDIVWIVIFTAVYLVEYI